MIQTTPSMRILVAVEPADFRKRLSRGRFPWWPSSPTEAARFLGGHQLHVLLSGGNADAAVGAPAWRPVPVPQ